MLEKIMSPLCSRSTVYLHRTSGGAVSMVAPTVGQMLTIATEVRRLRSIWMNTRVPRAVQMRLWGEACANGLDNLSSRGHDAECRQSPTVDDGLTIYENLVLSISPVNHVDIDPQVASQLRRHTGGVQTRQSVRAVSNDNPGHFASSFTARTGLCVSLTSKTTLRANVMRECEASDIPGSPVSLSEC